MFFIDDTTIRQTLEDARNVAKQDVDTILDKADTFEGLTPEEVAALIQTEDAAHIARIFAIAGKIKERIYGRRVVMFAPLYVSDYCVNGCAYCGYKCGEQFLRRRLTMDEIRAEVKVLERMGHKRLALEAGEDPVNCPIEYILECLRTIYTTKLDSGEIRRVNVNIAATTVENYRKLKEAGIGTYILFQETYDRQRYEQLHPTGPKHDYVYHTTAFDRAMEAGIDDVGGGVLFGLGDWKYDTLSLMLHNRHLEEKFGVGFHTISVPRLCKAEGINLADFPDIVDDETFLRLTAIIRLAVPFTGMIISTRESAEMRGKLIRIGISQMSGGSNVNIGGYSAGEQGEAGTQFEVADTRTTGEVLQWIMSEGMIPSFCTACYRSGRTGDRFMSLAKSGNIGNVCLPNALMTLQEYVCDYGDADTRALAEALIGERLPDVGNEKVRALTEGNLAKIRAGKRDLYI